jgi:two-component system OmpR family sensor kinase
MVTIAVALLAVVITGVVSASLVRSTATTQARNTLGRYAELVAARAPSGASAPARSRKLFQQLGIDTVFVFPTLRQGLGLGQRTLPADLRAAAAAGQIIDETTRLSGRRVIVEARPLDTGGDVVLIQPVSTATSDFTGSLRVRLLLALLCGLAVAAVAGVLLARWLARPLQTAAAAAHRLASGSRDVAVPPAGPAEVAEVAEALNALSGALSASEARQREFLLSVSHELRTPLTAVKGYAEALADGVVPSTDVARTGATVLAEAQRLDRLVNDLLDLARLGAQDFRVDLSDVDAVELIRNAAVVWTDRCEREGVRLRLETPDQALVVRSDPTRLRQIVDGLAENALRVVPAGAPIVFATRRESSSVVIEVRDGGPGLSDDDLRVAFERSALYDRYRGVRRVGTGVGLALVGGLAERLGGQAVAGHAAEGGARFTIHLPG